MGYDIRSIYASFLLSFNKTTIMRLKYTY